MVVGITYTDENMTISAGLCHDSMCKNGMNKTMIKTRADLSTEFRWFNRETLNQKRGVGYWLWKPYIIYQWLLELMDGDYLIYSDAGVEWIESPKHIIDVMTQDIFLFTSGHLEREYNKMDVMRAILPGSVNDLNGTPVLSGSIVDAQQVHASVIFIRVSEWSRRFIKEWLLWCQMPDFITDAPSKLPNHPDFKDHRHDQAILSCLAHKYNLLLHYWPDAKWFSTQRYRWPNDQYPLLFNHHRRRNDEY